jgi:hemoglobin/transferrin/lactoferrin receptor protein
MLHTARCGWSAVLLLATALAAHPAGLAAQTRTVQGRVLDSLSARPVAGAAVSAGSTTVTTDADGRFTLAVPPDALRMTVRRVGYRTAVLPVPAAPPDIRLAREPVVLTSLEVAASTAPAHELGLGTQLGLATAPGTAAGNRGTASVAEALEATEGISTSRPGAWGAKAFLRGLGGERVTVLLDGSRLNRACNVGMDAGLATVNPDNIERVEVLAGPGSTLYGSGNVGGVINVVTRAPRDQAGLTGEVRTTGSTALPGARAGASLGFRAGRVAVAAAVDGAAYDDYRSPEGTVPNSSFRDLTADVVGTYGVGLAHRVDARVQRYVGRDIGYPGSGNASIPEEDRLLLSVDYGWQASRGLLDGVSAKLSFQGIDHFMTMAMTRPPAMPGGAPMEMETDAISDSDTWAARAQVRLRPGRALALDAGAEVTRWNAEGTRWIERRMMADTTTTVLHTWPGVRVTDLGGFAQGSAVFAPWLSASLGGRLDHVRRTAEDSAGTREWVPSGNAGLRVSLTGGLFARASVGFGYRIPDPTELYGLLLRPDGFLYLGNPTLETETSRNVEASLGWSGGGIDASATVFRNQIAGFISPAVTGDTLSGTPVRQYRNVADARIDGVTASVAAQAAVWLVLRGSAGYTRGENRATGAPLPLIPPFETALAVRAAPAGFPWLEPELVAAVRQSDAAVEQGEIDTPGYAIVNLRAGWVTGRTSLILGVENLFDRSYRRHLDPQTLRRPGRNVFARIVQQF